MSFDVTDRIWDTAGKLLEILNYINLLEKVSGGILGFWMIRKGSLMCGTTFVYVGPHTT